MRNIYEIPSVKKIENTLDCLNFKEIKLLDITKTTTAEQRKTDWMTFESLEDFLDKNDDSKTIEGYHAPMRAVFMAKKP
jgi:tRNA (mo5U34)-methyltransferase